MQVSLFTYRIQMIYSVLSISYSDAIEQTATWSVGPQDFWFWSAQSTQHLAPFITT